MSMQGMPVTSEQGLRLGAVTDAFFDPFEQRIIAFVIDWENDIVRGPEDLLPITQVSELTADTLTVPHEMGVTAGLEYEFQVETEGLLLAIEHVTGRPVEVEGDGAFGTLVDMLFDPGDGSVACYEVAPPDETERKLPNYLLQPDHNLDFGDSKIVLPKAIAQTMRERSENPPRLDISFLETDPNQEPVGEDDIEVTRSQTIQPF
jgi:uncharacterized protein YrrD